MDKGSNNNSGIINFLAFVALVLAGVLIFINKFLPLVGVNVTGMAFRIMELVQNLAVLIVIGIAAFNFVRGKGKVWKILFWIALLIFVAGAVMGIF